MAIHLSVVMPVYNERYLVAESVRRVLAVRLVTRVDEVLEAALIAPPGAA
jgi:glycosyltransferase involved in cell wall biosynthesis